MLRSIRPRIRPSSKDAANRADPLPAGDRHSRRIPSDSGASTILLRTDRRSRCKERMGDSLWVEIRGLFRFHLRSSTDNPRLAYHADVLVLLVVGIGFLALFAVWQRYVEKKQKIVPLIPLGVFALDGGRASLLLLIAVSGSRLLYVELRGHNLI